MRDQPETVYPAVSSAGAAVQHAPKMSAETTIKISPQLAECTTMEAAYRLGHKHARVAEFDAYFGTPCEAIRHQHDLDAAICERDAALAQVAVLRGACIYVLDNLGYDEDGYLFIDDADDDEVAAEQWLVSCIAKALANTAAAADAYRARIRDEVLEEAAGIAGMGAPSLDDPFNSSESERISISIRAAKGAKP